MSSSEGPRLQVESTARHEPVPNPRKRPRKSRSKGLRTRTGCITCRKRHKKCDEVGPICGNCSISERPCVWPETQALPGNSTGTQPIPENIHSSMTNSIRNEQHDHLDSLQEIGESEPISVSLPRETLPLHVSPQTPAPEQNIDHLLQSPVGRLSQPSVYSPSNTVYSDTLPADLASVRWLDLLAQDAVQANRGFSRAPSPFGDLAQNIRTTSISSSATGIGRVLNKPPEDILGVEPYSWQLEKDIELNDFECTILRNFIDRAALWIDIFDPGNHFSVYATRLALRNVGLMKAILALSAQHLFRQSKTPQDLADPTTDPNLAIQYYYETLHYLQIALQYNTYTLSEEILATALIISTYEMLDESQSGWKRHLKGVFWIQRSQDVDGASGGIRQAVWWAWLRQDVWAAFRERRRCFSFWKPVKDYPELNEHELADRATYLFSQAVNYSAEPNNLSDRVREARAVELLAMLDRWKSFLNDKFKPLPSSTRNKVFQPIWIHPPKFAVALQIYYFARILITLHRPAMPGFKSYLKAQRALSEAVAAICGMAIELKDEGCQIISSQCLFGAGLCVQDVAQRTEIIALIELCESRTGWPTSTLRDDLHKEWEKIDSDGDKDTHNSI
ncbi:hypothetical protein BGZ60DRAFT_530516 [Tricladium varicosporioides]|nr:hypothetical protein BGZ60DRAFT_530516 [Hymenoscyphus varicosporioides]